MILTGAWLSLAKNPLGVFGMREGMEISLNGRSMGRENLNFNATDVNSDHLFPCSFEVERSVVYKERRGPLRGQDGRFLTRPQIVRLILGQLLALKSLKQKHVRSGPR